MDQRSCRYVLLLILAVPTMQVATTTQHTVTTMQQDDELLKGEKLCPDNWICPSNVSCEKKTACRCIKDYYQCKKKGVRVCRDVQKKPMRLTCPKSTLPPTTTNCNNHICPEGQSWDKSLPCIPGYTNDNGVCVEVNECRDGTHQCDAYAECKNIQSGYYCECKKGFQRENVTEFCPSEDKKLNKCTDINECKNFPGICGSNFVCRNTHGSYNCTCDDGFTNVSNTCVVKNKCEFSSSELEKKEECDKMSPPDAACSVLLTTIQIFNSSCHSKSNKSIEEAKRQLKIDTINLNDILNKHKNSTDDGTDAGELTTDILRNVESLVLKSFVDAPRTQTINTTQLDVSIQASQNICSPGVKFFTMFLSDNVMQVLCDQFTEDAGDGGIFIVYKALESSLKRNILFSSEASEDNGYKIVVNSRVVTGAIKRKLTSNVTFILAHIEDPKPFHNLVCVFWDPMDNRWSENGCTTEYSKCNRTHTTCSCNHLSSFALLMAPYGIEHDQGLSIVSHIGLSLSVFCLALSLLTFILCRSLRSSHTSVLTAMCSCLFLGQLLFLVGIQQTCFKILCSIIAGALHFLFLCAFCWMFIESVLLFMTVRNLRAVNYMTSRKSNFPMMCLLGFGVPTVIVGISAAVRPDAYGTKTYCWLKSTSAVWSFLGPVAVFIVTNTILLVLTVVLLRNRLASLNTNVSTLKNSRLLSFKAMAQLFILGCTWGIGYFQFGINSPVISYIFTICNSLQGVYIFLVHCVLNNQVRQEYRKLFCKAVKHRKQSSDDTSPHDATKSVNLNDISKPVTKEQSSESETKVHWK
ncbi:adhesion G protein-coupled receptor E3-like [Ranitomeya imitator]|uniref:adhesion G protein-coupled receptor E3-like n=1 Tax=Ranitomeya imitator TaxID=111125 RepID=UPI0037E6FC4A